MSLDRLWWGGYPSGALIGRTGQVSGRPLATTDADTRLEFAIACCAGLLDRLELREPRTALLVVSTLVASFGRSAGEVAWHELDAVGHALDAGWREVEAAIGDTGLVGTTADGFRLSRGGVWFVTWWLQERWERGGQLDR